MGINLFVIFHYDSSRIYRIYSGVTPLLPDIGNLYLLLLFLFSGSIFKTILHNICFDFINFFHHFSVFYFISVRFLSVLVFSCCITNYHKFKILNLHKFIIEDTLWIRSQGMGSLDPLFKISWGCN